MPIPKHFRLVFRGIFSGTPETWSFGVHAKRVYGLTTDPTLADVNMSALNTAWVTLAGGGARIPSNAKLTDIRAYAIGTNGRAEGNVKLFDLGTDGISGATGAKYPLQCALVATLKAVNRGPARFGRIYLPTAIAIQAADSRVADSDAAAAATSVADFLKACSDAIDVPDSLTSAPMVNVSTRGGPDGTLQEIDHVEVGRVVDTLRTRRKSLLEERMATGHIDW